MDRWELFPAFSVVGLIMVPFNFGASLDGRSFGSSRGVFFFRDMPEGDGWLHRFSSLKSPLQSAQGKQKVKPLPPGPLQTPTFNASNLRGR